MKKIIRITGAVVIVALLAAGCGGKEAAAPDKEAKQEPEDVNSITIRPEMVQRITIGQPTMVDLADKLQVPSRVEVACNLGGDHDIIKSHDALIFIHRGDLAFCIRAQPGQSAGVA